MGNLFTAIPNTSSLPTATTVQDGTNVSFNTGNYFNKLNNGRQLRRPSPQSVNLAPSNFSAGKFFNIEKYMQGIGIQESGGNYNRTGALIRKGAHAGTRALGKYQFMPKTLQSLGFNINEQDFLKNTKLQEEAMRRLTFDNARRLGIENVNKMSMQQTKALAMAHYAGVSKAKKYLNSGLSADYMRPQTTTGSNFPSITAYGDSVLQHMQKLGYMNKALKIFNKLINGE